MRISLLLVAALAACSHDEPRPEQAPIKPEAANDIVTEVQGDTLTRTFDLNHDQKADDWKVFKLLPDAKSPGKTVEVLIKRELDTNFDGKPDIVTLYNEDGTKSKESFDLDFDGHFDVVDTYEKGILVRKETFHGVSPKPD